MSDTTSGARDTGGEAAEDVRHAGERLAGDARHTAEQLGNRARDEARSQAERAQSGVATEISGFADALRRAADDTQDGSVQKRLLAQFADGLANASDTIQGRDLEQIAGDVSQFARRNPVAFLGGAALAGFAATRFAKASTSTPRSTDADRDRLTSDTPSRTASGAAPDRSGIPGPATMPSGTPQGTGVGGTAPAAPHISRTSGDY